MIWLTTRFFFYMREHLFNRQTPSHPHNQLPTHLHICLRKLKIIIKDSRKENERTHWEVSYTIKNFSERELTKGTKGSIFQYWIKMSENCLDFNWTLIGHFSICETSLSSSSAFTPLHFLSSPSHLLFLQATNEIKDSCKEIKRTCKENERRHWANVCLIP